MIYTSYVLCGKSCNRGSLEAALMSGGEIHTQFSLHFKSLLSRKLVFSDIFNRCGWSPLVFHPLTKI